ncbi:MAG: hypothetical protein H6573_27785 [Lewinellaceae bacterium]|nr:hypothetical protein [Phaeodactylibacter sp.]MCB9351270.1 hypothetical protein [Lewinellaceae bacterium]
MKHILLSLILILALPLSSDAQVPELTNATIQHNKAERPCIMVAIESEPKALKEAWQDFIKDNYDVKLKGIGFLANKDLLDAEKVQFKAISDKEMNFYTFFDEKKDKTEMYVFASLGYDIYLDRGEYPQEYRAMRNIVDKFVTKYVPSYYQQQVAESQDLLSSLKKEIGNLMGDISDNQKAIEKNLKAIDKLRDKNKDLSSDLDKKQDRLKEVQQLLEQRQEKLKEAKKELQ